METAETARLRPNTASQELRPPPAHGKYDLAKKKAMQRRGNIIKLGCISIILVLFLAFGIYGVVLLVSFKKAEMPHFQVKSVQVSKFDVANIFISQQNVLSTDIVFNIESDNKNSMVGVELGNMVMETNWNEMNAHLGETHVVNVVQKTKGVSKLQVSTHGEVELSKKVVNKEDMKLEVVLSGTLKFFNGAFKTQKYPFMVTCNDISSASSNVGCDSKLYTTGKPPESTRKGKPPPAPQGEKSAPGTPVVEDKTPPSPPKDSFPPVKVTILDKSVILSNGFLEATIAKPAGYVTGIKYNGIDNILDTVNPEDDRGYWDVVWAPPGTKGTKGNFQRIVAKDFRVIMEKPEQIELSFKLAYNPTTDANKAAPMEIDQRYVMLQGVSGIYAYGIFERAAWAQFGMPNARLAFKLQRQQFKYMVIADNRQREMPVPEDRMKPRGQELEYPEAVLLVDPIDPKLKGEVDDKYQYSMESQDIRVHGWICKDPPSGFWQITPSFEFRSGGPNKQFLTSHVGPSTLAMFVSAHYSGEELIPRFQEGEPWNHIYGPIFMYMNNLTKGDDFHMLWDDAKQRMLAEVKSWPYSFPASENFPKANERVNVSGRFFVHDKYVTNEKVPANGSFIGLGPVGEAGSWQRDAKTYQFWTRTDDQGYFNITFVRVGEYDLHGWVNGYVGDFKHKESIKITVGRNVDLGDLVFEPIRDGPTLWEIGVPDRLAKEFFVPDPDPKYVNKLYVDHPDRFRQYGLWERYAELYPKDDLVYDVNASDYKKDWFYAQVTRKIGARYNGTTWQVKFNLNDVVPDGVYKLRLALASATNSDLEVRFNEPKPSPAIFTSGRIGNDNSIARHGIHGLYWLFNIDVKGSSLRKGNNTMFLTQTKGVSPFQGIMYDYIRLEGPSTPPK
ncbi:uncharacterized protein LOC141586358 [Silene latifolia]|uniref:uncharacterized protein LOC141586358 n=1 Tax=Silene latifolia TaxID=37657 RepID=UPI003D77B448